MNLHERLAGYEISPLAVWLAELDPVRFLWANRKGIELWQARDLEDLRQRDVSDISQATRIHMRSLTEALLRDPCREEKLEWTLHPRGVPLRVSIYLSSLLLENGQPALLHQAVPKAAPTDPTLLRCTEAVRHISAPIALLAADGTVLSRNPAAIRAFGLDTPLSGWFQEQDVAGAVLEVGPDKELYRAAVSSRASGELRFYNLEARKAFDPAQGGAAILLYLLDETARLGAERDAEEKGHLADRLGRALEMVREQKQRILQLSAPLLPTSDGALTVPLIGPLDEERMKVLAERLLAAVAAQHTSHVVLDLTGASIESETDLGALASLVQALKLLGSRVIMTGIRPDIARSLVNSANPRAGWSPFSSDRTLILRRLADGIEACRERRR